MGCRRQIRLRDLGGIIVVVGLICAGGIWWQRLVDSQNRPLIVPHAGGPYNVAAILENVASEAYVGSMLGLPVAPLGENGQLVVLTVGEGGSKAKGHGALLGATVSSGPE